MSGFALLKRGKVALKSRNFPFKRIIIDAVVLGVIKVAVVVVVVEVVVIVIFIVISVVVIVLVVEVIATFYL